MQTPHSAFEIPAVSTKAERILPTIQRMGADVTTLILFTGSFAMPSRLRERIAPLESNPRSIKDRQSFIENTEQFLIMKDKKELTSPGC
jgi:hypothetical protein